MSEESAAREAYKKLFLDPFCWFKDINEVYLKTGELPERGLTYRILKNFIYSNKLDDFKELIDLTNFKPTILESLKLFKNCLSIDFKYQSLFERVFDRIDKVKEFSGFDCPCFIIQLFYSEISNMEKATFFDTGKKIIESIVEVEEQLGIKPTYFTVQKMFVNSISNGRTNNYRFVREYTGVEPSYDSQQEGLLELISHGRVDTLKRIVKSLEIKPAKETFDKGCELLFKRADSFAVKQGIKLEKALSMKVDPGLVIKLKQDLEDSNHDTLRASGLIEEWIVEGSDNIILR